MNDNVQDDFWLQIKNEKKHNITKLINHFFYDLVRGLNIFGPQRVSRDFYYVFASSASSFCLRNLRDTKSPQEHTGMISALFLFFFTSSSSSFFVLFYLEVTPSEEKSTQSHHYLSFHSCKSPSRKESLKFYKFFVFISRKEFKNDDDEVGDGEQSQFSGR